MEWFRFYDEVLDDPKVQRLPAALFRDWINVLCLCNRNDPRGVLPSSDECAYFYIPQFLKITDPENQIRADRLRFMPYPEYLGTWEWESRKMLVRCRDKNACRNCGLCSDAREMHVHHKTYERRGVERLSDLITLCDRCHGDEHRHDWMVM